jgi:hypothetical protein
VRAGLDPAVERAAGVRAAADQHAEVGPQRDGAHSLLHARQQAAIVSATLLGAERHHDRVGIAPPDHEDGQEQLGRAAAIRGLDDPRHLGDVGQRRPAVERRLTAEHAHESVMRHETRGPIDRAAHVRRPPSARTAGKHKPPDVRRNTGRERRIRHAEWKRSNVRDHCGTLRHAGQRVCVSRCCSPCARGSALEDAGKRKVTPLTDCNNFNVAVVHVMFTDDEEAPCSTSRDAWQS